MISSLRGPCSPPSGTSVVVEVGGVGLSVRSRRSSRSRCDVGDEASLRTALIVREDDLALFGFAEATSSSSSTSARRHRRRAQDRARRARALSLARDRRRPSRRRRRAVPQSVGHRPQDREAHRGPARGQARASRRRAHQQRRRPSSVSENVTVALVGLGWPERVAMQAVEDALASATDAERATVPALLRLALVVTRARSERGQVDDRTRCARRARLRVGGRTRLRGRAAPDDRSPSSSASRRCAGNCSCCCTPQRCRTARPTTSCSRALPGSARRRSR